MKKIILYIEYYWPEMRERMKEFIRNCMICNKNKYDGYPTQNRNRLNPNSRKRRGISPFVEIFYAQKIKFITCAEAY